MFQKNTKNDVKEIYKVSDDKIFVTNHGYEHLDLVDPLNIENIENLKNLLFFTLEEDINIKTLIYWLMHLRNLIE